MGAKTARVDHDGGLRTTAKSCNLLALERRDGQESARIDAVGSEW